jgi:bifunctional UDP-N-acetylglucosamine pyrophosphorylase / glucosamine-1-phosphate N-acetyltransferase
MKKNSQSLSIVILAAGKGTRMKSQVPKVLHKIAGREMINLVIDTAGKLNPAEISVVISEEMESFTDKLKSQHPDLNLKFITQKDRKGTADAVKIGINALNKIGKIVLVLYADTPLLKVDTLREMIQKLSGEDKSSVCVLGFDCVDENKYGRLVIVKNQLQKIVEFKDANPAEKKITLCNSGVVAIDGNEIKKLLSLIKNNNASKEYYLTDIIGIAISKGFKCGFMKVAEEQVLGVNSRVDLAKAKAVWQNEMRHELMEEGVTLVDPNTVYFSYDIKIASDVVIHPNVFFGAEVEIETGVEIKSFSHIEGALIKSGASIGPFARIRPGTLIGKDARIGNFVEIKKSIINSAAKVNHLSYIGDSEVGEGSNIGAGTITCNYDGYKKYPTKIGKNVFIGSNSALVAPVVIGDDAVIGAGSVITKDVGKFDLAISRGKQIDFKDGGKKYHQSRKKNK